MKKTGTGLLWSEPERWTLGQNCHLENITCPHCGSIEAGCVLHGSTDFVRSHLCQQCGGHIGESSWRVVAPEASPETAVQARLDETRDARSTGVAEHTPTPVSSAAASVAQDCTTLEGAPLPIEVEGLAPAPVSVGCWLCAARPAGGCASCRVEPSAVGAQGSLF